MKRAPFTSLLSVLLVQALLVNQADAQARRIRAIATPAEQATVLEDGVESRDFAPVSRDVITSAVEEVVQHWNQRELESVLSDQFFDRERLKQSMDTRVPRDANLRVQAVRDVQTLRQYIEEGANGGLGNIVSVVSATVETQIEYNTGEGFVRLPGVNEFIIEIRTPE